MSAPESYEYHVVPAPRLAPRIKGVRSAAERFAIAVAEVINEAAAEGWEYLRTDTLPMEARSGWLGGRSVTAQELFVFRRPVDAAGAPPVPTFERREPPAVTPLARREPPPRRPSPDRAADEAPVAPPRPRRAVPDPDREGPPKPRLGGARRD